MQNLVENDYIAEGDFDGCYGMTLADVVDALDSTDYYVANYRENRDAIAPDTLFLTKQEAANHIRLNHYHYRKPHTFAMTAWRSPQVKTLYDVLENTDWDKIIEALSDIQTE